MKIFIILLFPITAFTQGYEFGQIFQTQHGTVRNKTGFFFASKYDSSKFYGQHVYMIDAMEEADRRGWEFISMTVNFIDTTNPSVGQTTVVYLKRKRVKKT